MKSNNYWSAIISIVTVFCFIFSFSSSAIAGNGERNFTAHLSGMKQVPEPTDTRAQGQAIFRLNKDETELYYKLIVANIEDVLQAHIHLGQADENGPIEVWLYPDGPPPQLIPGRFNGVIAEGTITSEDLTLLDTLEDLVMVIRSGGAYVNVHTVVFPSGEIRGQIH